MRNTSASLSVDCSAIERICNCMSAGTRTGITTDFCFACFAIFMFIRAYILTLCPSTKILLFDCEPESLGPVKKPLFESKAIPVKVDTDLLKRIDAVAKRIQEPRSTVMRLAMRLGIEALEQLRVNTDMGELFIRQDELLDRERK